MRRRVTKVNVNEQDNVPRQSWMERLYLRACERLYDELAPQYDRVSWLVSFGHWRRWQRGIWDEVQGQRVLEMGCGTGAMLVDGTRRGLRMVGVELSPAMLLLARRRLNLARSDANLLGGDGMCLPLDATQFDTVMATFPAGYILAPATLAEVRRVLRVQGRFVILGLWVTWHIGWLARLLPVFYGKPSVAMRNGIVQRMQEAGFGVRLVEQRHGYFTMGGLVATPVEDEDGEDDDQ